MHQGTAFANNLPEGTGASASTGEPDNDGSAGLYEEVALSGSDVALTAPHAIYDIFRPTGLPLTAQNHATSFNFDLYSCPPSGSAGGYAINVCSGGSTVPAGYTVELQVANLLGNVLYDKDITSQGIVTVNAADPNGQNNSAQAGLGYYAARINVILTCQANCSTGYVFAFRLWIPSTDNPAQILSYEGSASNGGGLQTPFAMQWRGGNTAGCSTNQDDGSVFGTGAPYNFSSSGRTLSSSCPKTTRMDIQIESSCSNTGGTSGTIGWSDPDGYNSVTPQNWSINFSYSYTGYSALSRFGEQWYAEAGHVDANGNMANIGGQGGLYSEQVDLPSSFNNQTIDWQWNDVLFSNGVQFNLPVNSVNSGISCPQPPAVTISGHVQQATARPGAGGNVVGNVTVEVDDLSRSGHDATVTIPNGGNYYSTSNILEGDNFSVEISGFTNTAYSFANTYTDFNGSASGLNYTCNPIQIYRQQVADTTSMSMFNTASGACGSSATPANLNDNQYNFVIITGPPPGPSYEPFFNVQGGDIEAGIGYGIGDCSPNPEAGVYGEDSTSGTHGAGGQMAAIAPYIISGFYTNENPNYTPANPALTNNLAIGNLDQGGGTYPACVPDYYAKTSLSPNNGVSSGNPNMSNFNTSGETNLYSGNGELTLGNLIINSGQQVILVVNNNQPVYINGPITYGAYNSVANQPLFELIVSGSDIYIDPGVTNLRGIYIDEANGQSGGIIYTCGNNISPGNPEPLTSYGACDTHSLEIDGAVSATRLEMLRTLGDANTPGSAQAETFIYGPEAWLPEAAVPYTSQATTYNSIVSLPPVF